MSAWRWPDNVYDVTIVLLRGTIPQAVRWLARRWGKLDETLEGADAARAQTLWLEGARGAALIFWVPADFRLRASADALTHEAVHGALYVLRHRGVALSDDADEAFAYYAAWLFREMRRRLAGR